MVKKELLRIPGLKIDLDFQFRVPPNAFKSDLVCILFDNKMVLINIKYMTHVVKEINKEYGDVLDMSLNETNTLLACSTRRAGLKIFRVKCGVTGEIDLAECSGVPSRSSFSLTRFLKGDTVVAGQDYKAHTIYSVGSDGKVIQRLQGSEFEPEDHFYVFYHANEDIFVFISRDWKGDRDFSQSKPFFGNTKALIINRYIQEPSLFLLMRCKMSSCLTYMIKEKYHLKYNDKSHSCVYRVSMREL